MKTATYLAVFVLLSFGSDARAEHNVNDTFGLVDGVTEIMVLRPVGLIGTILGGGLFVATTPFTALANISPPHDAFEKIFDVFVKAPAKYTFDRPMGVYHRDADGEYRRRNRGMDGL